jgi:hypothetical protein
MQSRDHIGCNTPRKQNLLAVGNGHVYDWPLSTCHLFQTKPLFMAIPAKPASVVLFLAAAVSVSADSAGSQPNILWLSCEDISAHLGFYGLCSVPLGNHYRHVPDIDWFSPYAVQSHAARTRETIYLLADQGGILPNQQQ